jgi:hypothetical protein
MAFRHFHASCRFAALFSLPPLLIAEAISFQPPAAFDAAATPIAAITPLIAPHTPPAFSPPPLLAFVGYAATIFQRYIFAITPPFSACHWLAAFFRLIAAIIATPCAAALMPADAITLAAARNRAPRRFHATPRCFRQLIFNSFRRF